MSTEDDWSGLSPKEKVSHKNWKARLTGYEELTKVLVSLDEEAGEVDPYIDLLATATAESNANTLDKALEFAICFLTNAPGRSRASISSLVAGCATPKVFGARPKTKQLGFDLCMTCIQNEPAEPDCVINTLISVGLESKNPKVYAASVEFIYLAMCEFGCRASDKVINLKLILNILGKIFAHTDKNARDFAKQIAVLCHAYMKDAVKNFLTGIQPVQLKDLEDEFVKNAPIPPVKRTVLSKQNSKNAEEINAVADEGNTNEVEVNNEMDPFEFLEPVNVFAKMDGSFYANLNEPKWQTRKGAYEQLSAVIENQKISFSEDQTSQFNELFGAIKKTLSTDVNLMVNTFCITAVKHLAFGMRSNFAYIDSVFPLLIEKLKEKKQSFVTLINETLDIIFVHCLNKSTESNVLTFFEHNIFPALSNKNPSVKEQVCKTSLRFFAIIKNLNSYKKGTIRSLVSPFFKMLDDQTVAVREAAFGLFQFLIENIKNGSVVVLSFSEKELDPIKREKLLSVSSPQLTAPPVIDTPAVVVPPIVVVSAPEPVAPPPKPATPPVVPTNTNTNATTTKGGECSFDVESLSLSKCESLLENIRSTVSGEVTDMVLNAADWKERVEGLKLLQDKMTALDENKSNTEKKNFFSAVFNLISITLNSPNTSGLRDININVAKIKYAIILDLINNKNACYLPEYFFLHSTNVVLDKIADVKLKDTVKQILTDFSDPSKNDDYCSFNFVASRVFKACLLSKNVKNQLEMINWFTEAINLFGTLTNLDYASLIETTIKICNNSINADIKKLAVTTLILLVQFNPSVANLVVDLKPAQQQAFEEEYDKIKAMPAKVGTNLSASEGAANNELVSEMMLKSAADLQKILPEELFKEAADKNWKTRQEALTKLTQIISQQKSISANSIPFVFNQCLKNRLSGEANKNLVSIAITITGLLFEKVIKLSNQEKNNEYCLGLLMSVGINSIFPALVSCLNDTKSTVKAGVFGAFDQMNQYLNGGIFRVRMVLRTNFNSIGGNAKGEVYFVSMVLSSMLNLGTYFDKLDANSLSPNAKSSMLEWLCRSFFGGDFLADVDDMDHFLVGYGLPVLVFTLDKSPEVRKFANSFLDRFFEHVDKKYASAFGASINQLKNFPDSSKKMLLERCSLFFGMDLFENVTNNNSEKKESLEGKKVIRRVISRAVSVVEKTSSNASVLTFMKDDYENRESVVFNEGSKNVRWVNMYTSTRSELIKLLKQQMVRNFAPEHIVHNLFSSDFKVQADAYTRLVSLMDTKKEVEVVNSLHLLLKYTVWKFVENNSVMHMKCLESVVQILNEESVHFNTVFTRYEVNLFVPNLVVKFSDSKEQMRKNSVGCFRKMYGLADNKLKVVIYDSIVNCVLAAGGGSDYFKLLRLAKVRLPIIEQTVFCLNEIVGSFSKRCMTEEYENVRCVNDKLYKEVCKNKWFAERDQNYRKYAYEIFKLVYVLHSADGSFALHTNEAEEKFVQSVVRNEAFQFLYKEEKSIVNETQEVVEEKVEIQNNVETPQKKSKRVSINYDEGHFKVPQNLRIGSINKIINTINFDMKDVDIRSLSEDELDMLELEMTNLAERKLNKSLSKNENFFDVFEKYYNKEDYDKCKDYLLNECVENQEFLSLKMMVYGREFTKEEDEKLMFELVKKFTNNETIISYMIVCSEAHTAFKLAYAYLKENIKSNIESIMRLVLAVVERLKRNEIYRQNADFNKLLKYFIKIYNVKNVNLQVLNLYYEQILRCIPRSFKQVNETSLNEMDPEMKKMLLTAISRNNLEENTANSQLAFLNSLYNFDEILENLTVLSLSWGDKRYQQMVSDLFRESDHVLRRSDIVKYMSRDMIEKVSTLYLCGKMAPEQPDNESNSDLKSQFYRLNQILMHEEFKIRNRRKATVSLSHAKSANNYPSMLNKDFVQKATNITMIFDRSNWAGEDSDVSPLPRPTTLSKTNSTKLSSASIQDLKKRLEKFKSIR